MMYYVYALVHPRTNLPFYIGKTIDPKSRLSAHMHGKKSLVSTYIKSSLLRCGEKPRMEILYETTSGSDCASVEKALINDYGEHCTIMNIKSYAAPAEMDLAKKKNRDNYDIATRRTRIKNILLNYNGDIFRAILNKNVFSNVGKRLTEKNVDYIRIPKGDKCLVYSSANPYKYKRFGFELTSIDRAIHELCLVENIAIPDGENRSSSKNWGLA